MKNLLALVLLWIRVLVGSQEIKQLEVRKIPTVQDRMLHQRSGIPLEVTIPQKDKNKLEKNLPTRCLPTSSISSSSDGQLSPLSCSSAQGFDWTVETPKWKAPFIWLYKQAKGIVVDLFGEPSL